MKKLVFLAVPLIAIGYYLYVQMGITAQSTQKIVAEIELVNACDVPSDYFAVKKLQNGRIYSLAKGRVSIDAVQGRNFNWCSARDTRTWNTMG